MDLDLMWADFLRYSAMWAMQYDRMQPPPVVDTPVVIKGDAFVTSVAVGDTLTCTKGNWVGQPTTYTFNWKSGDNNVGTDSDSDSYVVADTDSGCWIVCSVTATNSAGSTEHRRLILYLPMGRPGRNRNQSCADRMRWRERLLMVTGCGPR